MEQQTAKCSFKYVNGKYEFDIKPTVTEPAVTTIRDKHGVYTGPVKDGKRNGYGVLTYKSGAVYNGEFKNNNYDGRGVYNFANGGACKRGRLALRGSFLSVNSQLQNLLFLVERCCP